VALLLVGASGHGEMLFDNGRSLNGQLIEVMVQLLMEASSAGDADSVGWKLDKGGGGGQPEKERKCTVM